MLCQKKFVCQQRNTTVKPRSSGNSNGQEVVLTLSEMKLTVLSMQNLLVTWTAMKLLSRKARCVSLKRNVSSKVLLNFCFNFELNFG